MKQIKKSELKTYKVFTLVEALGKQQAKEAIEKIGVNVCEVKLVDSRRTFTQNNALHLFFTQLADELNAKGLDMRAIIRDDVEISWTGYSVKENLWKPLQKAMFGKKSTTELDKSEEINKIWDELNRILTERTNGELKLPPFPSILTMEEELDKS